MSEATIIELYPWPIRRRPAEGGPGPIPRDATIKEEDVKRQRSLFCPSYDHCLDAAARAGWASWSCSACARFVPADEDGVVRPAPRPPPRTGRRPRPPVAARRRRTAHDP